MATKPNKTRVSEKPAESIAQDAPQAASESSPAAVQSQPTPMGGGETNGLPAGLSPAFPCKVKGCKLKKGEWSGFPRVECPACGFESYDLDTQEVAFRAANAGLSL